MPEIRRKTFIDVNRDDIRQLVAEMVTAGRTRDLIRNVVASIRGTFNEALEAGLKPPNPAARIGRFLRYRGDRRRRADPLTGAEETFVLAVGAGALPTALPNGSLRASDGHASW